MTSDAFGLSTLGQILVPVTDVERALRLPAAS